MFKVMTLIESEHEDTGVQKWRTSGQGPATLTSINLGFVQEENNDLQLLYT